MIKITDADVRKKIAEVEGEEWLEHDAWSEQGAGRLIEDTSVAHALRVWSERRPLGEGGDPDHITVYGAYIYGAGGWHRYYVTHAGEVVFSQCHGFTDVKKAEAAGFRIWR